MSNGDDWRDESGKEEPLVFFLVCTFLVAV